MSTVYERIGGEDAILAAASVFYDKVLADDRISHFFVGLNMDQQIRKQVALMSWAFGGPTRYAYRGLNEAHAGLRAKGLSDHHFDIVAGHLASSLNELGVSAELTAEALAIVESTRAQVMGRAE
jgi:hemoglobin